MAENEYNAQWEARTLNGWELIEEIGRGGMSRVYRARHAERGDIVALKVIHMDEVAADYERRLRREPEIQHGVGHENIVRLIDWFRVHDDFVLVMEYVEGRSLWQMIQYETGPIPFERARRYFRQIVPAVAHLHDVGVIHRDIKPSNILVGTDDRVKLADFGIAKFAWQQGQTKTQKGLGTPEYMSPEQVRGTGIDHRTDIYALGITLFEALTGRTPFARPVDTPIGYAEVVRSILDEPIPDPRSYNPDIPADAVRIIERATAKDPADRFQSCTQLLEALDAVALEEAPPTIVGEVPLAAVAGLADPDAFDEGLDRVSGDYESRRPASPAPAAAPAPKRRSALLVAALLLVVAVIGYGGYTLSRGSGDPAPVNQASASPSGVTQPVVDPAVPTDAEPLEIMQHFADAFEAESRAHDVDDLVELYADRNVAYFRLGRADSADIRADLEQFYSTIARTDQFDVTVPSVHQVDSTTIESQWAIAYRRIKTDGALLSGTTTNAVTLRMIDGEWHIARQQPSGTRASSGSGSTTRKASAQRPVAPKRVYEPLPEPNPGAVPSSPPNPQDDRAHPRRGAEDIPGWQDNKRRIQDLIEKARTEAEKAGVKVEVKRENGDAGDPGRRPKEKDPKEKKPKGDDSGGD